MRAASARSGPAGALCVRGRRPGVAVSAAGRRRVVRRCCRGREGLRRAGRTGAGAAASSPHPGSARRGDLAAQQVELVLLLAADGARQARGLLVPRALREPLESRVTGHLVCLGGGELLAGAKRLAWARTAAQQSERRRDEPEPDPDDIPGDPEKGAQGTLAEMTLAEARLEQVGVLALLLQMGLEMKAMVGPGGPRDRSGQALGGHELCGVGLAQIVGQLHGRVPTRRRCPVYLARVRSKYIELTPQLYEYLIAHGARQDELLAEVERETEALGGIAMMQIGPDEGALLALLARTVDARFAVELGTFTGYSAICVGRALPDGGRLLCCEISEDWAAKARANVERAGLSDRVEIRVAPAIETLRSLPADPPIDFAFVDADKPGYAGYYEELLRLMRPGGVMLLANVLLGGRVLDPGDDESARAMDALNESIAADERVDCVMLGVADGITVVRKR